MIERYPIRFAVLFGSHARGTPTEFSDVDIAIEFEESVSDDDRAIARIRPLADLMEELGTDEVDVADLDAVRPEIGAAALENGTVLVGTEDRATRLRERFERQVTPSTHEDRMDRFDELVSRMDGLVR